MNLNYITSIKPETNLGAEAKQISEIKKTTTFDIKVTDEEGHLLATCQALGYRTGKLLPFI